MTVSSPTRLETLFSQKLGYPVRAGEVVTLPVDLVMAHDATLALLIGDFERLGCAVWDPAKVMVTADHFCPPARSDWADLQKSVIAFCRRHGLDLRMYQGICHQLLLEDPRVTPGAIVVGADSHTTTAGAVGAFATGLGATDILACLARGETWFRVPESIPLRFTGARQPWVMGRDLALHLLSRFGESGASYRALEMSDATDDGLTLDARAAICCMGTEMGAKAALFVDGLVPGYPPSESEGEETIDTGAVPALVARPHSPANVCAVREAGRVRLDQVYIGSCAGGRLEDLAMAARLVAGRKVAAGLKAIVVPSSVAITREAMARGYLQTLLEAGFCVSNPSCGACGGIDKGVLAGGDVAAMTTTRNFQGRLGPRDSQVYLASTATCAASALTGYLTDPAEVWEA